MGKKSRVTDSLRAELLNIQTNQDGANDAKAGAMLPTPPEIVKHLDRYVIGHEHAKRMLATATYEHLMQCAAADLGETKVFPDNHCVVAGASGTGKSAMISALSDFLSVPVFEIDCTSLSPNGYKGRNVSNVVSDLENLLIKKGKTSPAIVVWEEIDKLHANEKEAAAYKQMTQSDALRLLDGSKMGEDGNLDTSKIIHIGCGAFAGLSQIIQPVSIPTIGFRQCSVKESTVESSHEEFSLKPDHLVTFGLITEFVGRFSRFALLDPLDHSVMRRIITDSESSVLKRKIAQFALHGVRLSFSDDAIDHVATLAMEHSIGARGLRMLLNQILGPTQYQLPDLAASGLEGVHFTKDSIINQSPTHILQDSKEIDPKSLAQTRTKAAEYFSEPSVETTNDDISIF